MYPSEAKELFHRKGCKFTYVGVDQTRRRPLRGAVHPLVLLHPSSRCDDYFRKTSTLQALFVAIQDTRDTHACSAQGDSRGDSRIARVRPSQEMELIIFMAITIREFERNGFFTGNQYCYRCGEKMNRKEFFKRTVKRGERGYLRYCQLSGNYLFATFDVYGYRWCCEPCDLTLDCKEQYRIADIQKRLKKKRLTADEVGTVALPEPPAPIPPLTPKEKRKQAIGLAVPNAIILLALIYVITQIVG